MDVHEYQPPSPFRERFSRDGKPLRWITDEEFMALLDGDEDGIPRLGDLYDATVAYNDHEIGRLLDALRERGLNDRTAVLVTADHGEPLGQRGHYMHGQSLHEEVVHVPVILYLPWQDGGRRVENVVSLLDVAPTLLDLAGVPVPVDFQGSSWLEALPADEAPAALGARVALEFTNRSEAPVAWYVRQGPWKLMMDLERVRLFHLPSDPGEERDVQREHPIQAAYLASHLASHSPAFQKDWRKPPPLEAGLTAEEREQLEEALRTLGYAR
jgi:arylsulfatase A-like enzyme